MNVIEESLLRKSELITHAKLSKIYVPVSFFSDGCKINLDNYHESWILLSEMVDDSWCDEEWFLVSSLLDVQN